MTFQLQGQGNQGRILILTGRPQNLWQYRDYLLLAINMVYFLSRVKLRTKDSSKHKLQNPEITNLKKIIGLETEKYTITQIPLIR